MALAWSMNGLLQRLALGVALQMLLMLNSRVPFVCVVIFVNMNEEIKLQFTVVTGSTIQPRLLFVVTERVRTRQG